MDKKTFFDNFETIANAPGGIARLRELILDLAVMGKLVPRKSEWRECLLGEVAKIRTGKLDANASSPNGKYPFFTCAKDPLRIDSFTYDTECVLLAGNGNFDVNYYSGKFDAYQRTYILEARDPEELSIPFLFRFMQGHSRKLLTQSIGGVIKYIKIGFLTEARFQLPSFAEQEGIVAKVDELMSLCDELEAAQNQRDSVRTAARKSAIDSISIATTPDELNIAWKRISNNWTTIADTPESIASLRSLILNLAVRGKLVSQIASETSVKVESVKGKFELPKSWKWVKISTVTDFVNGFAFKSEEYCEDGTGIVRMGDLKLGQIAVNGMKRVPSKYLTNLDPSLRVSPGDLVIGMSGSIGKPCFNMTDEIFLLNQRVGKFVPHSVDKNYLAIVLQTLEDSFLEMSAGSGIKNLSTKQIKDAELPLPPALEQKRIVSKADELMTLCDQLEQQLIQRNEVARKIASSLASSLASEVAA